MARRFNFLVSLLCLWGLAGCNFPPTSFFSQPPSSSRQPEITQSAIVTAPPNPQNTPSPVPSSNPSVSQTLPSTLDAAENPGLTQVPTSICNIAAAGKPIDVTIPDDTQVGPGDSFVKTWRLVNSGSCTWSKEYAIVYFSGMYMAFRKEEPLREDIQPGQSLDISVDMVAPDQAGLYQSNWKLRDGKGSLFGIGPGGNAPFWVRVLVVAHETSTLTPPLPVDTPTPSVKIHGSVSLAVDQSYDLDAGAPGPGSGDDLLLLLTSDQLDLSLKNGAKAALYGPSAPGLSDCRSSAGSTGSILLKKELVGMYFCVQTDQGLPASLYLVQADPAARVMQFQFTVWSLP